MVDTTTGLIIQSTVLVKLQNASRVSSNCSMHKADAQQEQNDFINIRGSGKYISHFY